MSSVPPIALLDTASNTLSSSPKSILKSTVSSGLAIFSLSAGDYLYLGGLPCVLGLLDSSCWTALTIISPRCLILISLIIYRNTTGEP